MILRKNTDKVEVIYQNMQTQFPKNELKDFDQYKNLILSGKYIIYDTIEDKKRVGYVIIVENSDSKYIWIDYLAILKEFHSQGYGKELLKELKNKYKDFNGCFLEVEKINSKVPNTLRRVKFYERQGAIKLPVNYYFPTYNGALPMDLYYIPYKQELPNAILSTIKYVFEFLHSDIKDVMQTYNKITLIK